MKELLSYTTPNYQYSSSQVLIVKLGSNYAGYVITESSGMHLYSIGYCGLEEADETNLVEFAEKYQQLTESYKETLVIIDLPGSVLLPYSETAANEMLMIINGLSGLHGSSVLATDDLAIWQLKNNFTIPAEIDEWLNEYFPSARIMHQDSVSIMNLGSVMVESKLLVDFRNNEFSLVAATRTKLLFAKTFGYETPADVLYYLLRVCEQFSFSPKEVTVKLSGLIEKESSLFKDLYQYFLHIDVREAGWGAAGDYPAHFFTSFNDVIKCVS